MKIGNTYRNFDFIQDISYKCSRLKLPVKLQYLNFMLSTLLDPTLFSDAINETNMSKKISNNDARLKAMIKPQFP